MLAVFLSPIIRYAAFALVGATISGTTVGVVQEWRYGSKISDLETAQANLKKTHAQEMQRIAEVAAEKLLEQQKRTEELQIAISQADLKHSKELKNANNRIARLRADLRSGAQQLRINSGCIPFPSAGVAVASAAPAARMVDGTPTGGRICGSVAENLATLAGDADAVAGQLRALQDYVKTIQPGGQHE